MRESADKNSRLICQVLKLTNCEKCGAKGHSAFLCKNSAGSVWEKGQAKDAREREFRDQMEMKTTVLPSAVYTGQGNIFAVLNRKVASLSVVDDQDDRIQQRKRERDHNKCRRTLAPPPQLVVPVSVPVSVPVPSSETGVSAGWVKLAPLAPVIRANTRWSVRPTIMVEKRPVILERAIVELVELPIVPISTLMINCLVLPKSTPKPNWADMADEEEAMADGDDDAFLP